MAVNTDLKLQKEVIYSVYLRNHTEEGTFNALIPDLDRIKALGTDIIWLMPIHPIGVQGKKGELGCPYANRDYRTVNPEYGNMADFKHLVDEIRVRGMKCMIDVVYNHTSPDSTLVAEHPEYFYHKADGSFGNKIGDWADVIDLDYHNQELWQYQIDSLVMWAKMVDGFRCDVASFVPVDFWIKARAAVAEVNPDCIWLAESVHRSYGISARKQGIYSATDVDIYEAFDLTYEYDIREVFDAYLKGETTLTHYADLLNFQETVYPENYNKMRFLENHDTLRIASMVKDEQTLVNYTAMLYFLKGTTLIYAGQECENEHTPSLFDIDRVDWHTGKDLTALMQKLYAIKQELLDVDDFFEASADDAEGMIVMTRENKAHKKLGIFSLQGKSAAVSAALPDGEYVNQIDQKPVHVADGRLMCEGQPIIIVA